jgi:hypothetical protein
MRHDLRTKSVPLHDSCSNCPASGTICMRVRRRWLARQSPVWPRLEPDFFSDRSGQEEFRLTGTQESRIVAVDVGRRVHMAGSLHCPESQPNGDYHRLSSKAVMGFPFLERLLPSRMVPMGSSVRNLLFPSIQLSRQITNHSLLTTKQAGREI